MSDHQISPIPQTRAPQARGIATRERLLHAAKELFARKGYEGTSIGDVARSAGTGVGTVYHHFADKRAILIHLLDRHESGRLVGESGGPFADALAATDARAAVEHVLVVLGSLRREQPSIYGISLDLARRDEAIAARCRRIEEEHRLHLQRDLERAQRNGHVRAEIDPESCAVWLHLVVHSSQSMLADAEDPEALRPLTRELSELICNHLLPR